MADHATEAGHWYTQDGQPHYTMIGKNGKERNCTLRDAKKLGLWPSVTMIGGQAASPPLINWKMEQAIMAALTCPIPEGTPDAERIALIKADAEERAKKARERGTLIHAWIQQGFEG